MANRMSTAIIEEMVDLSVDVIRFCQSNKVPNSVMMLQKIVNSSKDKKGELPIANPSHKDNR